MTVQWSTTLRDNLLTEWATTIGASPVVKFWTGSMPAEPATADSGTLLASFTLNSTWYTSASSGSISMENSGTQISVSNPYSVSASNAGTAGYYRIYDSSGNCHEQGTITATGGGGDMTIDNTNIAAGQTVQITGFTKTAPGA